MEKSCNECKFFNSTKLNCNLNCPVKFKSLEDSKNLSCANFRSKEPQQLELFEYVGNNHVK
jgi:hypothetical protein